MNHAVISCLHANLAAVEAVLDDIDAQGIKTITRLIPWGMALTDEVIELVRQRGIPSCQGCWDEDIIDGLNACGAVIPRSWRNGAAIVVTTYR